MSVLYLLPSAEAREHLNRNGILNILVTNTGPPDQDMHRTNSTSINNLNSETACGLTKILEHYLCSLSLFVIPMGNSTVTLRPIILFPFENWA